MITPHPTVVSVNISPGGIPKRPIQVGQVTTDGLSGDGHDHEKHNTPLQAISLFDVEDLDDLRAEGFDVRPGAVGENVTVRDLSADPLELGDRLKVGEPDRGVELEVSKIRKPCYVLDAISPELKVAIEGRCGCYAKVLKTGEIRPGDRIEVAKRQ